jgi:1-acyl-sn-glycerol-3-phosphate acyltransferase
MVIYWLTRIIFKAFAKVFFRLKIEGLENLPKQDGFILAANHASSLDPFIVTAAIPRYIRWIVIYEYYDLWYLRWILRRMRFIRIENNLPKQAFRALSQGDIIGIFPEGRRSWDGRLAQLRPGAAALARRTSSLVVPLAVSGTFAALPRTRRSCKFSRVTVRIGKPLSFSMPENRKEDYKGLDQDNAQKIRQAVAELLC